MRNNKAVRIGAFIGSACLTVGLLSAAASATGAYFQDQESGSIQATIGSIDVEVSNGELRFENVLPGVSQTKTVSFTNEGKSAQDLYIAFDDTKALSDQLKLATITVGGTPITGDTPVLLRENFGPNATGSVQVRVMINPGVTADQILVEETTALTYSLIATQVDQPIQP